MDSAHLGDCLDGTWRILARGAFRPFRIFARESQSPSVLSDEFCRFGVVPITDFHTANIPIDRNVGVCMIVKTTVDGTGPTLSIFSHATAPIRGKRNREKWPISSVVAYRPVYLVLESGFDGRESSLGA